MNQQLNDNNINKSKIHEFMNKAIQDIAGSSTAMLVILGERLGLYKAMEKKTNTLLSNNLQIRQELMKG
jgi:hypothetical protein